ncbi:MAG: hypothetical protein H0V17_19865 [Deltaproteobacteria bacterium]|nr:hypothetical protein [Deltaproteobacteria bacterium]
MQELPDRPTSAGWYLVAFGLIGSALAISLTGFNQMREVVETMQRRVMPGVHEVALAGGKAALYYEPESELKEHSYSTPADLKFTCTLRDQRGKTLKLEAPTGKIEYASGPYVGRKVFDVDVVAPGTYNLACTADQPFVLALGGGLGAWMVVAIVGGLVPGLAGLIVIAFVTIKRRQWFAKNPGKTTDT